MYKSHPRLQAPEGESFGGFSGFDDTMQEALANLHQSESTPPAPSPSPAPSPAPSPTPAPPPPAPGPRDYPSAWKPEYADKWKSLPPDYAWLQEEALRREADYHRGLEPYKTSAAAGQRYTKLLEAHMPTFQQHGVADHQVDALIGSLLNAQFKLALGTPEEKLEMFKTLVSDYGIDPQALVAAAPPPDPNLAPLQSKLQTLESRLTAREQAEQNARREQIQKEISDFAKANADFSLVGQEVASLLRANPAMTLQAAYDQAIWLNPATRAKAIKAQQDAERAAQEAADKQRAEAAAAASRGSVRTPTRSANDAGAKGTMDDTMKETLAAIKSRG